MLQFSYNGGKVPLHQGMMSDDPSSQARLILVNADTCCNIPPIPFHYTVSNNLEGMEEEITAEVLFIQENLYEKDRLHQLHLLINGCEYAYRGKTKLGKQIMFVEAAGCIIVPINTMMMLTTVHNTDSNTFQNMFENTTHI